MSATFTIDGVKIDPPHSADCFCVEKYGPGIGNYIVYDGHENRDRIGRKRNGSGGWWHRFTCNDPNCPARLLVRYDVLMEWLDDRGVEAAGGDTE